MRVKRVSASTTSRRGPYWRSIRSPIRRVPPARPLPAAWESLLLHLQHGRAVHLVGLAGSGKSWLVSRLASPLAPWRPSRRLSLGEVLLIYVDGYRLEQEKDELWQELACHMMAALQDAIDVQRLERTEGQQPPLSLAEAVDGAWRQIHSAGRVRELSLLLPRALKPVVDAGLRPVFVFDHFDAVYHTLEDGMFAQLYGLHRNLLFAGKLCFVLVTRRPLDLLRPKWYKDQVAGLHELFVRHSVPLNWVQPADFDLLWPEMVPAHGVNGERYTALRKFSGGHLGLAGELYERWEKTPPASPAVDGATGARGLGCPPLALVWPHLAQPGAGRTRRRRRVSPAPGGAAGRWSAPGWPAGPAGPDSPRHGRVLQPGLRRWHRRIPALGSGAARTRGEVWRRTGWRRSGGHAPV